MLVTIAAALLQAAQPSGSTTPPQPAPDGQAPAWRAAGQAWGQCVKAGIDARLRSSEAPEALVDTAVGACTRELEAVRSAIAAERGAEAAAANVERVRSGGRAMFLAYVARERGQPAPAAPAPQ